MSEHQDGFLDLIERFVARGANIRGGSIYVDMIQHLLNSVEALEQANGGRPKNLDVHIGD